MQIIHTYKDALTGEVVQVEVCDQVSPDDGYTQAYLDRAGNEYEGRAKQQNDNHFLEWVKSEKAA